MTKKKKSILVVDDEYNILITYSRLLRNEPYCIHLASNVSEAFDILERESIDVIISDYRMSDINGLQFLKIAKEKYPNLVCAITSGFIDQKIINESLESGNINKFILKPLDNANKINEIIDLVKLSK